MPMSDEDTDRATQAVVRNIYADKIADLTFADVRAAVVQIDTDFEVLASEFTQNQTIEQNFNNRLPEPSQSTMTNDEKATTLAITAAAGFGVFFE